MTARPYFRGLTSDGTGAAGFVDDDHEVMQFVYAKFNARWRELTVTDPAGRQIGAISDHNGKRVWWAAA